MKRLLSDAGYTAASHLTAAALQLVLQIFVVRTTSLDAFGAYATALAISTTVETIFVTRSGELALQFIGRHWVAGEYSLSYAAGRKVQAQDWTLNWTLWAVIATVALLLPSKMTDTRWYVLLLGLAIPAQIGFGVSKSVFIASARLKAQALFEIAVSIASLAFGVVGVVAAGIRGLIVSQVLVALLKTLAAAAITHPWWPTSVREPDTLARASVVISRYAWWSLGGHSVLRNAFMYGAGQMDILWFAAVRGNEAVALYKVAKTLAALPVRAVGPIWGALRPRILQAWHAGDRVRMLRLIGWPSFIILGGLAVAALPASYLADDMLRLAYGVSYAAASVPLLVLLCGTWVFGAATAWYNFWVIISQERGVGTTTYAILFVLTLVGAWAFGSRSALGMAIAVSGAMVFTTFICWAVFLSRLRRLGRVATVQRDLPSRSVPLADDV